MKTEQIKTKRLVLREITESDAEQIVAWRSNPSVYRFFLSPRKISVEEHLDWYMNRYMQDENRIDFIAVEEKGRIPIGVFGVKRADSLSAEVSYLLDEQFQGKGYAFEAVAALMEFAKKEWNCRFAVAEVHRDNAASVKLANKLGMSEYEEKEPFIEFRKEI